MYNLKKLLKSIGIKTIHAPYEADIIIPYIIRKFNLEPFCLSDDTDFLPHQLNLLANFNTITQTVDYFNYLELTEELGMNKKEFIDMCIIMGCDYCKKIKGIGPMNAYKLIKQYKSLEIFFEKTNKLDNLNEFIYARNMFIQPEINYEIENDFKLTKIDIDNFNNICEILKITNNYKNRIIKIRQRSNYNPITNYFSCK